MQNKPDKYATKLREAMKGLGTDEVTIIEVTGLTSNAERQLIRQAYKTAFGRDLLEDFDDELSGELGKLVIGMYRSPVEFDVTEIFESVDGAGTDEDTLTEVVGSRSNFRLSEIKQLFKEKYNEEVESRISAEASGDYKRLMISLLQCKRDESRVVVEAEVEKDVEALYAAGEGKLGTDEETFNRFFVLSSPNHMRAVDRAYAKKTGKWLMDVIISEFDGDVKMLLKTVLHSHINPADYYAERIYRSCKDWGTKDNVLIRAMVTMDEVFMEEIKNIYMKKYGIELADHIKDETSGDYQKMLLALINS